MKKQLLIGAVVAGVCLYFVFRGLSFREMIETFRHLNPLWILLAVSIYLIEYVIRAFRWEILTRPIKKIAGKDLFAPLVIGFFANSILPLRMGELVRAHVAGNKFNISRTACLGTILVERIYDTLSFLTSFVVVALFFPFPHWVEKGSAALGLACVIAIVSLIVIMRHQHRFLILVERLPIPPAWRAKIQNLVSHFAHGVSGMGQWRHVVSAMALSLIIWTLEGTVLYLITHAFAVPLHYPQSFFLLFFMGLAVTLPQGPGYVGTTELFGVTAFSLLGIPKEQGLPVILAIHATQLIFIMVLGTWALSHEGLSVRKIMAERRDD